MNCLVVLSHPLPESLNRHFADTAIAELSRAGHKVELLDLYRIDFDPRLTPAERGSYYGERFDAAALEAHAQALREAEVLVLVFPTWWFGLPAMLKGWVDRVFAPGIAFDHANDFGPITPLLGKLRHVVAITTLGSPWWIDRLIMHRPVRRILKWGVFKACAPKARFAMLSFYAAEKPQPKRVMRFADEIRRRLRDIG
ncbi:NAD(P)H-dependent oxidoreductase [Aminobacter aminovorans]|uniref:NAD(P)H-dependent oxidoreductase n=1 Tax=Aminobacter aminovorans TaxID=83263 RepID=UPI00286699CC|nr:NAD(P)H-dependent oxidoreductase [Aminobacter aminovorans]MDR7222118.1 putative NADPH-quinone reductase [Aminobacter aminovorans]